MANGQQSLLPVMLLAGRGRMQPSALREVAAFFPSSAQRELLRTASLLQALQELQRAARSQPEPMARNRDPLELLACLSRFSNGPGGMIASLQERMQTLSRLQGMLPHLAGAMEGLLPVQGRGAFSPRESCMPDGEPPLSTDPPPMPAGTQGDIVGELQSALSRMDPGVLERLRAMAQQFGQSSPGHRP